MYIDKRRERELPVSINSCVQATLDGAVLLDIEVHPGAKRQGIIGFNEWRAKLNVAVRAQARNGMANEAVLHVLATSLTHSRKYFTIASGQISRMKKVRIESMDCSTLLESLERCLEGE